jgi:hypothetical protein
MSDFRSGNPRGKPVGYKIGRYKLVRITATHQLAHGYKTYHTYRITIPREVGDQFPLKQQFEPEVVPEGILLRPV